MERVVDKKKGSLPVYVQLANIIKENIATGRLAPGTRIPSESKLAKMYDVSPMTIRQAIGVLVEEGLIRRVHGSGTFVKELEVGATDFDLNVLDKVLSDAGNLSVRILRSDIARVRGMEGEKLQIEKNAPVILVERVISHREMVFCFQSSYLPFDPKAPVVENMLDTMGLSDHFFSNKHSGYKKGRLQLLPMQMNETECELLEASECRDAFRLEYTYYDFKDTPCAYGWFVVPHQQMPLVSRVGVWNE